MMFRQILKDFLLQMALACWIGLEEPAHPPLKCGHVECVSPCRLQVIRNRGHAAAGAVDWQLLVALLIGSLPGIWLGSALSQKIPERLLRTALAGMLILIGGKLAF